MSQQPEHVRETTDRLDAAGNVTKAMAKGFSIGSAALASFILFSAFLDEFSQFSGKPFRVVDIAVPEVLIGGLLGACVRACMRAGVPSDGEGTWECAYCLRSRMESKHSGSIDESNQSIPFSPRDRHDDRLLVCGPERRSRW
jgi:hypothetical protein